MFEVLSVISPLFIIILVSAIIQKFNILTTNWEPILNEFALKMGLPVLIFSSLANTKLNFIDQSQLILVNSLFIMITFVMAIIVSKIFILKLTKFRTIFFCLGFGNIAYLGIPVLMQISGDSILPIASLIVSIYLFWFFSLGILVLDYTTTTDTQNIIRKTILNLFTQPLIIAVILGLIFSGLNISLPGIIIKSLDMITASVTPTVLIVIGLFIGNSKFENIKAWIPAFIFSVCILILLPALMYFTLIILGLDPNQFYTSIIQAAMPLAITPFALADKYSLNKNFIAKSIVLSTVLSTLSLPFWIYLLQV
jgi:predicted permease